MKCGQEVKRQLIQNSFVVNTRGIKIFDRVQESNLFIETVRTAKKVKTTSFNFTFSTTAEGVVRTTKTVFELIFFKVT